MRIYVRTAPFPVVARAKKGDGKRGGSCVKRSAILIVSSFSRCDGRRFLKNKGETGAFLFSQSGEKRLHDQSMNTLQTRLSSQCNEEIKRRKELLNKIMYTYI